ncbi:unnamed protein product [Clonostachys rosea]|uniref:Uncharacterized protein n=1 Tax=Bionectria ochroleuca TaxID=29856 RepID=A0ABY6V0W9_BIOOC|nr:unnamed protein product [Clonostachys rosea]
MLPVPHKPDNSTAYPKAVAFSRRSMALYASLTALYLSITDESAHYQQPHRLTSGWTSAMDQQHASSHITESGPSTIVPTLPQVVLGAPERKPLPAHGDLVFPGHGTRRETLYVQPRRNT